MYRVPAYRVTIVREGSTVMDGRPVITRHQEVVPLVRELLRDLDREQLVMVMLDAKSRIIGTHVVSIGSLNSTMVPVANIAKAALLCNAACFVLAHNHPSGDPEPSPEDVACTEKVKRALDLFEITILDHIVIGEGDSYSSLCELGRMPR